jgi:hypothetical protein
VPVQQRLWPTPATAFARSTGGARTWYTGKVARWLLAGLPPRWPDRRPTKASLAPFESTRCGSPAVSAAASVERATLRCWCESLGTWLFPPALRQSCTAVLARTGDLRRDARRANSRERARRLSRTGVCHQTSLPPISHVDWVIRGPAQGRGGGDR